MEDELNTALDQMKADAASWVTKLNTAGNYNGANYLQGLLQHVDMTQQKVAVTFKANRPPELPTP